ncbi:hypothetical protein CRG49_000530 [Neisseria sp. N95_16]|uniref:Uncharacterized protein n=1 Tax=Neisseria brasiliensis TaxID=2666100 RepID=A0A7X2GZ28_9NEIS|nr:MULTISPECIES: hypothetical protein [Neisseria]MRN38621.1 hypothetical protein [Neisseria brasiliensis]PJO10739.1 hypothetical protein CRG49_000530 [Neisseria sp. N95_16]
MMISILAAAPSAIVAYMMICRLNAKKRRLSDLEGWAFLLLLGGAVYTVYAAISYGKMPSMGKLFLDFGICLYFGSRTTRTSRWLKRRLPNV